MPELPEVETTRRGITPHLLEQTITRVIINNPSLRWPIPPTLPRRLQGETIRQIGRRAKYLLLDTDSGTLILHLGMSGSLRLTEQGTAMRKHDHFILQLGSGMELRLHDPRRFGAVLWHQGNIIAHPLIRDLGPEPLQDGFNANYLLQTCKGRKSSIKQHIMNSKVVVGVGNIYASESLFLAGIHPKRAAGRIAPARIDQLVQSIKAVLGSAIEQGGTTLRDFVHEDGKPGYFKLYLNVYGRTGEPCHQCQSAIRQINLGQRSTFYCVHCQR